MFGQINLQAASATSRGNDDGTAIMMKTMVDATVDLRCQECLGKKGMI